MKNNLGISILRLANGVKNFSTTYESMTSKSRIAIKSNQTKNYMKK